MSLRGSCTICTDYFDTENDISVTQCGHLFHFTCLSQWMKTCGAQRTCPQCRTRVTTKQIIEKIFINIPEEDEDSLDPYDLRNQLVDVQTKLKHKEVAEKDILSSLKAMEETKDKLLVKIKELKSKVKSEQNTVRLLKIDLDAMKTEVQEVRFAKDEAKQLRIRLKMLEKVEVILNGQKSEVDSMLNQYITGQNSHEAKQLATFCVAMKQEYETIKESRMKLNSEMMKFKRELHRKNEMLMNKVSSYDALEKSYSNLRQSEEALNKENQSLQRKLTALQQAITSPSDTRSSAINRLIAESPAPQYLTPVNGIAATKDKRQHLNAIKPIHMKKPRLSLSLDSEDIDLSDEADNETSTCHITDENQTSKSSVINSGKDKVSHPSSSSLKLKSLHQNNYKKLGQNSSAAHSSIRSKLIANKYTSNIALGYDGLGGHKKLVLSRSNSVNVNSLKYSSTNTMLFHKSSIPKNRFERLKRVGPK